jgi:hypothetical protein
MQIWVYNHWVPSSATACFVLNHVSPKDLTVNQLKELARKSFQIQMKDLYQFVLVHETKGLLSETKDHMFMIPPIFATKRTEVNKWIFQMYNGETMTFDRYEDFVKMNQIMKEGSTSEVLKEAYQEFIHHRMKTVQELTLADYFTSSFTKTENEKEKEDIVIVLGIFHMNYISVFQLLSSK